MTQERFTVEHRASESRYALLDNESEHEPVAVIGEEAYVDVLGEGAKERVFYHTVVSEDYGGQGLAAVLVRNAVEHAVGDGHKIAPVCPYVAAWFKKNTEYAEHAVAVRPEHLQAIQGE